MHKHLYRQLLCIQQSNIGKLSTETVKISMIKNLNLKALRFSAIFSVRRYPGVTLGLLTLRTGSWS